MFHPLFTSRIKRFDDFRRIEVNFSFSFSTYFLPDTSILRDLSAAIGNKAISYLYNKV